MAGGGSFTSDQTTLTKTTAAVSLLRAARTRVTSIQGRGEAGLFYFYTIVLQQAQLQQVI